MAILACGGESYARLRLNGGLEQGILLETEVDFTQNFSGALFDDWEDEYFDNVIEQDSLLSDPWDWTTDDLLNPSEFIPDEHQYLDSYLEDDFLYDRFERFANANI